MEKKHIFLAGFVMPLIVSVPINAMPLGRDGAIIVAQQQQDDKKTPPGQAKPPQKPPAAQPPHPAPPAAQQPMRPPQAPVVQQPVHPHVPAVQQPTHVPPPAMHQPTHPVQPPAAQQQIRPASPPPAAQQQLHPTAPPPAAQHPIYPPPPPAAQQGHPAPPPAFQQRPAPLANPGMPQQAAPSQPQMPAAVVAPQNREQVLDSNRRADEWRSRRIQDLHTQRQEVREGNRTVIREPDRTIVQENGRTFIRHNEVDRLSFGARDVRVEQRGRNTVTIVERPGGIRIVTVVDPEGHLLRRSRFDRSGREIIIINTPERAFRRPGEFFLALPPPIIRIPRERYIVDAERVGEEEIYETLMAPPVDMIDGAYSLDEIRYNASLRDRMARVDVDTITFETGAWEVTPDQIGRLAVIADAIQRVVSRHPEEVFLIEGHTDAVGSDVDNLSLSDRRAQSVAEILATQFQVPAENLVTQGYGEQYLKIPTQAPERRNRRVAVRRITPLMGQNAQTELR